MRKWRIEIFHLTVVMLTACAGNANSSEDTESVQSEAYSTVDKILLSLVLHEIDDNLADSIIGEAKRVLKMKVKLS